MSTVINKSNHPVEIKRIPLTVWTLRAEIEQAISHRLHESPEGADVDIEDIKNYYTTILNAEAQEADEEEESRQDENVDSSGNPMDDDAAAMMAALQGDGEDEEEAEEEAEAEASDQAEEEAEASDQAEEDDEAAKLAAEMLGDQAQAEASEDDEAAKLAAEMLDGQTSEDSETEEPEQKKPFERTLLAEDQRTQAFLMLSDINMERVIFFAKSKFIHGQNIVVNFEIPNSFHALATVTKCFDISRNSKIISEHKPSHRIHAEFELKFPGERSKLREFLKSIEPTIPAPPKKIKRPDSEEDDDFDDLGF